MNINNFARFALHVLETKGDVMAQESKIEWVTRFRADGTAIPGHTFNAWMGCTKHSPACDNCYAERDAVQKKVVTWGPNGTRKVTRDQYWANSIRSADKTWANNDRAFVFSLSWGDVFEEWDGPMLDAKEEVLWRSASGESWISLPHDQTADASGWVRVTMHDVRVRLFRHIARTSHAFDWLLLTKRADVMRKLWDEMTGVYADELAKCTHPRYDQVKDYFKQTGQMTNSWAGATTENQKWGSRRLVDLIRVPAVRLFISAEPLIGPLDLTDVEDLPSDNPGAPRRRLDVLNGKVYRGAELIGECPRLSWVITGGESGNNVRPGHPDWYRKLRDDSVSASVPFHFKQWGEILPIDHCTPSGKGMLEVNIFPDGKTHPPIEVREGRAPLPMLGLRVGRRLAGRVLDGNTWNQYPASAV